MGRKRNVGTSAIFDRMSDDVAASVDARRTPERAKLRQHPFGPPLLEECRCGHAAKLQVLFVDPLLLPNEGLQRVAQGWGIGQFGG